MSPHHTGGKTEAQKSGMLSPKIPQPKTSGLPVLKGFKPWQVDWGQHQSQELGSGVRIPASLVVWTSLNLSFPLHQMGTEMVPTA